MVMPFAYPGNAMINFQPLDSALKDYQTGMQVAGESTAKINAANAMKSGDFAGAAAELAKVDPRAALEYQLAPGRLEAQRMENEKSTRTLLGGTAEALSAIQDPALQQKTLQSIAASDPKWARGFANAGFDVNNPAHVGPAIAFMREEALGPQAPENRELKQAQAAQARHVVYGTDQNVAMLPTSGARSTVPGTTVEGSAALGLTPLVKGGTTLKTQEERQAFIDKNGAGLSPMQRAAILANGKLPDVVPDHKMIQAADESVRAADNLINNINDALTLSPNASSGAAASIAPWRNWLTGGTLATQNAETFNNIVQTAILPQMRQLFGGRVTNVDVLLMKNLAGAATQPPEVREEILRRTVARAQQLRDEKYSEASQAREGDYYRPGGGTSGAAVRPNPNVPQSGPATGERVQKANTDQLPQSSGIPEGQPGSRTSPVYPPTPAAAAKLPSGTYFMTPDGRLKVAP